MCAISSKKGIARGETRARQTMALLVLGALIACLHPSSPALAATFCEDHIIAEYFDAGWNQIGYTYVINHVVVDWWGEDEGYYARIRSWTICGYRGGRWGPTQPLFTVASPQEKDYLSTESLPIEVSLRDPESELAFFEMRIDGNPVRPGDVIPLSSLREGVHLFTAVAGNHEMENTSTVIPFTVSGAPSFDGGPSPSVVRFQRGDADSDTAIDMSDAVGILGFLFLGNPGELGCEKSADVDDSGVLDLSDAVALLSHLFVGGAPPGAPFPSCGDDGTPDELTCESSPCG